MFSGTSQFQPSAQISSVGLCVARSEETKSGLQISDPQLDEQFILFGFLQYTRF
jgi:hypothetical protein